MSRTYEPDDPELGQKRVKPFPLHELEHIPRDHRNIYQALLRAMPEAMFDPGFKDQLSQILEQYLGFRIDMFVDDWRIYETNRLRGLIPGTTCLVVLGLAPRTEKLVVEVDLAFAHRVISALLGTTTAGVDSHRPMTEIEQGVFLYVALKVLAQFHQGWVSPEQLALRIEDVRNDVKSAADIFRTEHRWLVVSWKLAYDIDVGFVRILVPEGLARGLFLTRPPPGSALAEAVLARTRERLAPFLDVPVEGWIEVGRIELSRPDLEELEAGDIILLEGSSAHVQSGAILGSASMRVGYGQHAVMPGELVDEGGKHAFRIHEIVIERIPDVHDPYQGHGEMENPEQVVAEYEDHGYDESGYEGYEEGAEGGVRADDVLDEDEGLDDANDGDDEYEDYDYSEGYEEGGYEEQGAYEEGGDEEQGGYEEGGYEEQGGYSDGGEAAAGADNLAQAGALLGDIPMVVVVELGRVQLTADEVIRLRAGQLIELGRSPTDPVDLVVNGKLVAKGELVEIEGALGVKLVSLVKEGA